MLIECFFASVLVNKIADTNLGDWISKAAIATLQSNIDATHCSQVC
jgi:hypothetical protein